MVLAVGKFKLQMSAGKILIFVFWDAHGILFIDPDEKVGFMPVFTH